MVRERPEIRERKRLNRPKTARHVRIASNRCEIERREPDWEAFAGEVVVDLDRRTLECDEEGLQPELPAAGVGRVCGKHVRLGTNLSTPSGYFFRAEASFSPSEDRRGTSRESAGNQVIPDNRRSKRGRRCTRCIWASKPLD
jgi:hypothetical protein